MDTDINCIGAACSDLFLSAVNECIDPKADSEENFNRNMDKREAFVLLDK